MSVLEAHRQRVAALQQAMEQLHGLHLNSYDLWSRIVQVAAGPYEERRRQIDTLHDEAYALGERIGRLREASFGEIDHESLLLLTSTVESIQSSLLAPEGTPAPGE